MMKMRGSPDLVLGMCRSSSSTRPSRIRGEMVCGKASAAP